MPPIKRLQIDMSSIMTEINELVHTHIQKSVLQFNTDLIRQDIDDHNEKIIELTNDMKQLQITLALPGCSRIQQSSLHINVTLIQQEIEDREEKKQALEKDMSQLKEECGMMEHKPNIVLDIREMSELVEVADTNNYSVSSNSDTKRVIMSIPDKSNTVMSPEQTAEQPLIPDFDLDNEEMIEDDVYDEEEFTCVQCSSIEPINQCYLCDKENICSQCEGQGGEYGKHELWICSTCAKEQDVTNPDDKDNTLKHNKVVEEEEEDDEGDGARFGDIINNDDEEEEEEEEEEGVFEIEIEGVSYFTTGEENGTLYNIDVNGEPDEFVGHLRNGKICLEK